jgi:hypothetical protein
MEPKKIFRLLSAIRGRQVDEVRHLLDLDGVDPDTKFYLSGRMRPAICIAVEARSVEIGKPNRKVIQLTKLKIFVIFGGSLIPNIFFHFFYLC